MIYRRICIATLSSIGLIMIFQGFALHKQIKEFSNDEKSRTAFLFFKEKDNYTLSFFGLLNSKYNIIPKILVDTTNKIKSSHSLLRT